MAFNMDAFRVAANKLGIINLEAKQKKAEDQAFLQNLFAFLDKGNRGTVKFSVFSYFVCQLFSEPGSEDSAIQAVRNRKIAII